MHKKLLITFGCSWTAGTEVECQPGMTDDEYRKFVYGQLKFKRLIYSTVENDQFSFRGLLCKKYGYINKNFAIQGSSNAKQLRLAKIFFASSEFKQLQTEYSKIIVLWGITATSRSEFFDVAAGQRKDIKYNDSSNVLSTIQLKYFYDHDHEIRLLRIEMEHWDQFFEQLNIKNFWFDSFNHHYYGKLSGPESRLYDSSLIDSLKIEYHKSAGADWPSWEEYQNRTFTKKLPGDTATEIFDETKYYFAKLSNDSNRVSNSLILKDQYPRDLLSQLAISQDVDCSQQRYHDSVWNIDTMCKTVDSNRLPKLMSVGILNKIDYHPTKYGHELLTEFFVKHIGTFL